MSHQRHKYIHVGIGIIIAVGLLLLPFLSNGVFFQHGRFILDAILLAILIAGIILTAVRPNVRMALFADEGLRYGDLAIGLLIFLYIIALFYAASLNLAVDGAVDALALLVPYLAFRFSSVRRVIAGWTGLGLVVASVVIDILGLANGWGQLKYPSATELTPQHQVEIASVFQYHNAYAVFAASVATGLFVWSARSTVKWVWRMLAVGVAGLNVLALLASGSRGALALWAVVMLVSLIGLRQRDGVSFTLRSRFLGDVYLGLIGGVGGYVLVHHAITKTSPGAGWLGIVLSLAIPMVLVAARSALLTPRNLLPGRRGFWSLVGIGVVIAVLGGAAKFHSIMAKLQSYQVHQESVSQRFIFWGDGMKIFGRNPVTGSGAGAWQAMYQKVESYPYISARVHSFGVNILMETGIVGFICLIALVWPLLRNTVWPAVRASASETEFPAPLRYAFIAAGLMLVVHSLMDWDMGFEYLEILFYASAGTAAALTPELRRERSTAESSNGHNTTGRMTLAVTSGLSIIGFVLSFCAIIAQSIASGASPSGSTGAKSFLSAYRLAPYNDAYLEQAASALLKQPNATATNQRTAEKWIGTAARLNPFSPTVTADYSNLAYSLGDLDIASKEAMVTFRNAPFNANNASLAINVATVDALNSASKNPSAVKTLLEQAQTVYADVQRNKEVIAKLPSYLPPSGTYELQPFSLVSVAAAEYILGSPQQAAQIAMAKATQQNSNTSQLAQLIVLMAQSGSTSTAVNQFVSGHPPIQSSYQLVLAALKAVQG